MRLCPCKGCTIDRHAGCHANCRNYLSWREENLALLESVNRKKEAECAGFNDRTYRKSLMNKRPWK